MRFSKEEIAETIRMISLERLDIRTVTLGINLGGCIDPNIDRMCKKVYKKITLVGRDLVEEAKEVEIKYRLPIVNKRIAVTPLASLLDAVNTKEENTCVKLAKCVDAAAEKLKVDYIGGYSALVHKGFTKGDELLIDSIPKVLNETKRLCSSVNVATTKSGINMDAVLRMGRVVKKCASVNPLSCTKLVTFANAPPDNPFMAGAFHGVGEAENSINVGISGPGVIRAIVEKLDNADFGQLVEKIKQAAFKITRIGELVGREMARRLDVNFGIVDLSLAPTPFEGDSVAGIIEAMGLEKCGAHGSTLALALLTDAVKKGGVMATSYVGGLSGAFIPVSEDKEMAEAVAKGAMSLDKLEAMTSVCSVGLDMVVVPSKTSAETIAAIIADECAIGVMNDKATGVRIIPMGKEGEWVEFGGLFGRAPVMNVSKFSSSKFVSRGGRLPSPVQSLTD